MVQNTENKTDPTISDIKTRFEKAVNRRKWSMINEKIVPIATPPVITTAAAFSTLLTLWDYLPPQGQKIGVLAAGGISAASAAFSLISAFVRKDKNPVTTRQDAIHAIDNDIDPKATPADKINDKSADSNENSRKIFELNQRKIWKKWSKEIEAQSFKTGFGAYYKDQKPKAALHASIALAAAISTSLYGENALTKFNDALNWQPPPEPLAYEAWIVPPKNIIDAQGYLPEMIEKSIEHSEPITAHEGSRLLITTHERHGNITVNGEKIEPTENAQDVLEDNSSNKKTYQYEIVFDESHAAMDIDIEGDNLNIAVNIDTAPSVHIEDIIIDENNSSSIALEYKLTDDYGVTGADLETGLKDENGQFRSSKLPSAQLPAIQVPYESAPQGPGLN